MIKLSDFWSWKITKWWLNAAIISVPFGIIWATSIHVLGYESKAVLVAVVVCALIANYCLQGLPPDEL